MSSNKPKILIINFDYNYNKIKELQETVGVDISDSEIISIVMDQLHNKSMIHLMVDSVIYEMFNHLIFENNFINEINLIYDEYIKLAFKLVEQLSSLGCYNDDKLPYHFASLLSDDALIIHIVSEDDL